MLNNLGSCCVLNILILVKSGLPSNSEMVSFVFQVSSFSLNKPYQCDLDRSGFGTMQGKQSTSVYMHPYVYLVTLGSPAVLFTYRSSLCPLPQSFGLYWLLAHRPCGILVLFCCMAVTMLLAYAKTKYLHGLDISYIQCCQ